MCSSWKGGATCWNLLCRKPGKPGKKSSNLIYSVMDLQMQPTFQSISPLCFCNYFDDYTFRAPRRSNESLLNYCLCFNISSPSIHPSMFFRWFPFGVGGGGWGVLEPIPSDFRREAGPPCMRPQFTTEPQRRQRIVPTEAQFRYTSSPQPHIHVLDCGRKLGHPDRTHAETGTTCKLQTGRPLAPWGIKLFSAWAGSANSHRSKLGKNERSSHFDVFFPKYI